MASAAVAVHTLNDATALKLSSVERTGILASAVAVDHCAADRRVGHTDVPYCGYT